MSERYTVISSDCHAGAPIDTYRDYLDPDYRDEFDAWRGAYSNPFRDLQGGKRARNWDNEQRISELASDHVVAEVVFPNTVPPFFPTGALVARPPVERAEYERRWAGLKAHNRWMAEVFCSGEFAKRRAGIAQVFLNDIDEAIAEAIWAQENGLRGGILLPTVPDDTDIAPLYAPEYDRLWAVCADRGIVVNMHSGSGHPSYGSYPAADIMWLVETSWYAHRPLWQVIMSGVFERNPKLKFVMTESGCSWVPSTLQMLDGFHMQMQFGRVGELNFQDATPLPLKPSEYFARNVWMGVSFPGKRDGRAIQQVGVDRVMWGNDYPHHEGSYPYSLESMQLAFPDTSDTDLRKVFSENAARVYDFDLDALAPFGAEAGPTIEQIHTPLEKTPKGATSPAFYSM
jgi:predicted TIM-barrel fold metal-dependent hydrolase